MAERLPCDDDRRGPPVEFTLDDARVRGFAGESVAVAALASGHPVLARSLKYHRPRGAFCLDGHCGSCLMRIDGIPNRKACQVSCDSAVDVRSQNAYPGAEFDAVAATDSVFARGMDHHTLMTWSGPLNKITNKVVRALSGLGQLPTEVGAAPVASATRLVDVCIIGGGAAGLAAAAVCKAEGLSTVLVDDQLVPGGSLWTDGRYGLAAVQSRVDAAVGGTVELLSAATAIGYFPEALGGTLAVQHGRQLVRIQAAQWLWATGGYAQIAPFANNDRPGVLSARAVGRLLEQHRVVAGARVVVLDCEATRDAANSLVDHLRAAGADAERRDLDLAARVRGRNVVESLELTTGERLDCDVVAVAAVPSPASEGPRQHGCAVELVPALGGFAVMTVEGRTTTPSVWAAGDVCGYQGIANASASGERVARAMVQAHRAADQRGGRP